MEPEQYYSLAAAAFVVTCVVAAAVRGFHICRPYDRKPDYYYPGRKAVTVIYLTGLLLLPYVFFPESDGAWLLVKAYFLPLELYFLAILLFSYFGSVMHWRKWRRPTLILGGIALLTLLTLLTGPAVALIERGGGGNYDSVRVGNIIILVLGLFMTGVCLFSVRTVLRWTSQIDVEGYSNPEDFPVNFARKMVRMLLVTVVLLWVAALSDNRTVMAVLHLLMCVNAVGLLIQALHPHRHGAPEEEPEAEAQVYTYKLSPAKAKSLAATIRQMVEEERAFLDPHLTLQDVAARCGSNRTYVAGVFKTEFGGFFRYVNTLRLRYADEYQAAHPTASVSELADAAGFGSRQSYYKVKKALEQ